MELSWGYLCKCVCKILLSYCDILNYDVVWFYVVLPKRTAVCREISLLISPLEILLKYILSWGWKTGLNLIRKLIIWLTDWYFSVLVSLCIFVMENPDVINYCDLNGWILWYLDISYSSELIDWYFVVYIFYLYCEFSYLHATLRCCTILWHLKDG